MTSKSPVEIPIKKYISEEKEFILAFIEENRRVLLNASPGSGKTTFFANLCITHLQNKKKGRIIFCSPYLIIQGQFKRALEKKNINVDLELNAASRRKQLLPQDKIITTTYKSLRLIEEDLHSNDLLIIDEAHSLLYSYKKEGKRDFFVKAIQSLYKTSAKMVLMTGTPYHGITKLLSLSELRVVRSEIKARVKVDYSNTKYLAVALSFAENCLMQYGKEKLNVIYIRNTKKCDSIKSAIEDNFKCKAFVLTSKRKQTAVYKTLEKESFIQKDYQFLITTNVISTGANILNDNIGKALMIDEFNPTEIKQFSKRFRKKPDIEIEIVNKNYLKNERPVEEVRQELIEERNHQRFFYQRLLDAIKIFYTGEENLFKFDRNFHNETFIGSPVQLLESTIERLVIQEAYFVEQISYTFNTPIELVKALNKHDDVTSVLTESIDDNPQQIDDGIYKQLDELKYQSIVSDFIVRQDNYFQALLHYFTSIKDAYEKWKLEDFLKARRNIQNIKKKDLDKEILEIISQFDFISRILYPLYTVDEFIQDIPKSLYLK
ncbi:DEAD/DEAH box helicase family protein [Salinimicrobium tongyeongense]|uniref:DEAD/DEAH box helicase family protein n=1 Tax=Salinimicrobium tongyeongense TaxID=2809707 RepID=A0ABY6NV06_9FLAO|nr:DEAD/DEAH box helicase family protein [Salinimicrobium tongyeongense]UZH56323.1 DEAD/DEAH box helicase family protein [Salinimicrobium tongyeongense]